MFVIHTVLALGNVTSFEVGGGEDIDYLKGTKECDLPFSRVSFVGVCVGGGGGGGGGGERRGRGVCACVVRSEEFFPIVGLKSVCNPYLLPGGWPESLPFPF